MRTFWKLLLFFFILLVGIGGIAIYWTFYRPLPDYEEHIALSGLSDSVSIDWDTYGVPHIYAQNKEDLYYALGYVHAQDRLWQMTVSQMAAQGRFAEFLGPKMVPFDKHQRTIGFWKTAQKIEQQLSDSTRNILQAYADGVNTYTQKHSNDLPIQFSLAEMNPIPWSVTHTLALSRLLAWELNVSWWSEVTYGYLAGRLDSTHMANLLPRWSDEAPTTLNKSQTRQLTSALMKNLDHELALRKMMGNQGDHVGSNAWVADGSKTESGFPLLAGDPHLGISIPGKWYEVHLHLNGRDLSGATVPGAPTIVVGQNDFMAWSLTNIMADDTDFFAERLNPEDRGQFLVDSTDSQAVYQQLDIERELIPVKGQGEVVFERRSTRHGPLISDVYPADTLTGNVELSMQWTGNEPSNEIGTLLRFNWAQSFDEVKSVIPGFKVPGQNLIYADRSGNIAMFSLGKIPIRKHNPILFRKGWDESYDWQGYVPYESMPKIINPEKGWIANANNKLYTDDYPYHLATFWEPPSRIERIRLLLQTRENYTPSLFQLMQNDTYSQHARDVTARILPVLRNATSTARFDTVISYLENWDFRYEPSATAASILDVFYLNLTRNTMKDELGDAAYRNFIRLENLPVRTMDRFLRNGSVFFDNINTDSVETMDAQIIKSMQQTTRFLRDSLGTEPFQWRWSNLHKLNLKPTLFGRAADQPDAPTALKLIVNNLLSLGPYPIGGHGMSINNTQYDWRDPYNTVLAPSIRRVVDFANLGQTYSIMPTGQSGNPLSVHYSDQTEMWLDGDYRIFIQDSTLFHEEQVQSMILYPQKP